MAIKFILGDQVTLTAPAGVMVSQHKIQLSPGVETACVNDGELITDIILAPNARLTYYQMLTSDQNTQITQARESFFHGQFHALNYSKNFNLTVTLAESGAECELYGLMLARGSDKIQFKTVLDHQAPHCSTQEHFKSIVDDKAQILFKGLVKVAPGADKTDSNQQNKNLLLSKSARVESKPELEIYADDVKAAHGATVGQLDNQALFYLQSRGISLAEARVLLIQSFATEILDTIQFAPFRLDLNNSLTEYFSKEFAHG